MPRVILSRELRFGLHEHPPSERAHNGFAGNPALAGLAPFLTLTATVAGHIDPATGMLINIKLIDRLLRDAAVPMIRAYAFGHSPRRGGGDLLLALRQTLHARFSPHTIERLTLCLSPYLTLQTTRKEPAMVLLSQRFEFSAAHRLHSDALSPAANQDVFGRCNNANGHGHNYELEVTLAGEPDPRTGEVFPIPQLQEIVTAKVIDLFDHKHLNLDCPEFSALNPTVENIARVIHDKLRPHFHPATLKRIRIWETPKTCCEYPAE